jgi:FkbM family methyltransferase
MATRYNLYQMKTMFATVYFIWHHPLNSKRKLRALLRYAIWQIWSRIVPGPVVISFVNNTHLVVRRGMTSATGNIYCGLFEFEAMAFVLHALRPEDTFVDIGANIGAYTVLAGGAVGCRCFSVEPAPETYADMVANLRANGIASSAENIALGHERGVLLLTKGRGAYNHVSREATGSVEVPVETLDEVLKDAAATIIKMDVEGYEKFVIEGANKTLTRPDLQAVVMEIFTNEGRFGYSGDFLLQVMRDYGFEPYRYCPYEREFVSWAYIGRGDNVVFARDMSWLLDRVKTAPKFEVRRLNVSI